MPGSMRPCTTLTVGRRPSEQRHTAGSGLDLDAGQRETGAAPTIRPPCHTTHTRTRETPARTADQRARRPIFEPHRARRSSPSSAATSAHVPTWCAERGVHLLHDEFVQGRCASLGCRCVVVHERLKVWKRLVGTATQVQRAAPAGDFVVFGLLLIQNRQRVVALWWGHGARGERARRGAAEATIRLHATQMRPSRPRRGGSSSRQCAPASSLQHGGASIR